MGHAAPSEDCQGAKDKYRGLSTARRTMLLSGASVEMTWLFG
jgi:hypothetical protein